MRILRGKSGAPRRDLRACLEFDKELSLRVERLHHYASLCVSEDSSDAESLKRERQLQNLLTKVAEASSFITPEIQAIDDSTFDAFLADPLLADWQITLRKIRRLRPHTLSEPEERLLALGASALHGHHETFSQLTNVDMKFGVIADEKGVEQRAFAELVQLLHGQARRALCGRRRSTNFTPSSATTPTRSPHRSRTPCAPTYSLRAPAIIPPPGPRRSSTTMCRWRFTTISSPPSARTSTRCSAIANCAGGCSKLDEIHQYDTAVPMVSNIETRTSLTRQSTLVIESLAPLGTEYTATLADGLRSRRWCDRYESRGKRSGAFSSSSYGNPPFILMNYKEDVFADIYTLAHEAGHSMHTWFSQREQLYQNYDYPIFLAEVASTFNEELLDPSSPRKDHRPAHARLFDQPADR